MIKLNKAVVKRRKLENSWIYTKYVRYILYLLRYKHILRYLIGQDWKSNVNIGDYMIGNENKACKKDSRLCLI